MFFHLEEMVDTEECAHEQQYDSYSKYRRSCGQHVCGAEKVGVRLILNEYPFRYSV